MESIESFTKNVSNKNGFFNSVFSFEEPARVEMLNLIQYAFLSIPFVVLLNKGINKFSPETEEDKSSLEITFEIIIQILVIFIGLYFINKIILYIPTYSGEKYPEFTLISVVLTLLMIFISFQTKIGEKINILIDRLEKLWNGEKEKVQKNKNGIKVSQPISQAQNLVIANNNPSNMNNTSLISNLPTSQDTTPMQSFDNYYQNTPTPMPGANTPGTPSNNYEGFNTSDEPVAANSVLGGSFGVNF
jgi:glucan phosphoethanolaminetransferase (alkaline phosphatase superfamily)